MKFNRNIFCLILVFISVLTYNICMADDDNKLILFKTPTGGMSIRQILKEVNKLCDNQVRVGRFREFTLEIEIQNLPLNRTLDKVVAEYNKTAKNLKLENTRLMYSFRKEENYYVVDCAKRVHLD